METLHHDTGTLSSTKLIEIENASTERIVVTGLYRSGSTAIAGVLHRLGVDMGSPFFGDYYESSFLSANLRYWWQEPFLIERIFSAQRIWLLNQWISQPNKIKLKAVGAKHPLLCLCSEDILSAWGQNTKFIWAYRSLDESIASLAKQGWWHPLECRRVQEILWEEANAFFSKNEHLRLEHEALVKEPVGQIKRMIEYLHLSPNDTEVRAAADFILSHQKEI